MVKPELEIIRRRYEAGEGTYRELAAEHGVALSTLARYGKAQGWQRPRHRRESRSVLDGARQQLIRAVEEAMDRPEVSCRELKELSALLRELLALDQALTPQEDSSAVEVVLQGETEEWSQ